MWPLKLQVLGQILIQLYGMQITMALIHPRQHEAEHMKHSAQFDYLSQKRPLWVLADEVQSTERDIDRITFTTTERPSYTNYPYYFPYRQNKMLPKVGFYKRKSLKSKPTKAIKRLFLPENYLYAGHDDDYKRRYNIYETSKPKLWRRHQPVSIPLAQADFTPSMPVFDSVPTDIGAASDDYSNDDGMLAPIFVYNGPKGELIMNTMLSARKYPMQEPVPGEILYPPTEPIFRPKPIVQSFRMPGRVEPLNLTLIPFYAHEAIVPRFMFDSSYSKAATAAVSSTLGAVAETTTTTTANAATVTATRSPAVLYAAAAAAAAAAPTPPFRTSSSKTSTTPPKSTSKKRRHKKAKKYAVYRSADEVHWRPTEPTSSIASASTATTSFPLVLASPLQNHRFNLIDEGYYGYDVTTSTPFHSETKETTTTTSSTTTTPKPMKNFKLTYKDEDSQFQIVYVDESLEKPTTKQVEPTKPAITRLHRVSTQRPLPLLSSHYSSDKEYYAFPVYTLGKLLRPDNAERPISHASHSAVYRKEKPRSTKDADTWFIMNSRYKGHRSTNYPEKLSSKYVEIGPTYDAMQSAETTIEKAII